MCTLTRLVVGVQVYDGATPFAPVLGVYSGTKVPISVHSTGPDMVVRFYSDRIFAESGFHLNASRKSFARAHAYVCVCVYQS